MKKSKLIRRPQSYSVLDCVTLFFLFSFLGWLWEVGLFLVQEHRFIDRGFLHGPWLPIYGAGSVLVICLFRKTARYPALIFLFSAGLCSILEYMTSWIMEDITGMRWWDYQGCFLNLNGRVCLEAAVVFGLGSCAVFYMLAPFFHHILRYLSVPARKWIAAIFFFLFLADCLYSVLSPNLG